MSASESKPLPAISLDQWIALNAEIAALVRAGVPLERGLADLATDLPGGLGRFTASLAEQMQRGEALAAVLAREAGKLPPLYRAVVEAGVRSGRLSVALEGLAATSRRLADARRAVASAFVYPLVVVLLAWELLVFYVVKLAPAVSATVRDFHAPTARFTTWLAEWGPSARFWAAAPPAVIFLVAVAWCVFSTRPAAATSGWPLVGSGGVPWLGRMVRALRLAAFADVLAVLVDGRVPLDEGLELAGQASGDRRLARKGREMADAVRRGEPLQAACAGASLPPMLRWLMAAGQARGALAPALRHAAETYRGRAVRQAEMLRVALPMALTVLLGGTVVVAFALLVFSPWIAMIHKLAEM